MSNQQTLESKTLAKYVVDDAIISELSASRNGLPALGELYDKMLSDSGPQIAQHAVFAYLFHDGYEYWINAEESTSEVKRVLVDNMQNMVDPRLAEFDRAEIFPNEVLLAMRDRLNYFLELDSPQQMEWILNLSPDQE